MGNKKFQQNSKCAKGGNVIARHVRNDITNPCSRDIMPKTKLPHTWMQHDDFS